MVVFIFGMVLAIFAGSGVYACATFHRWWLALLLGIVTLIGVVLADFGATVQWPQDEDVKRGTRR